jgi:hypothetical protein
MTNEIGCTIKQVKEVIKSAKMIKQRPVKEFYEYTEKLINNSL